MLLIFCRESATVLQQDSQCPQLPAVNGISDRVQIVNQFISRCRILIHDALRACCITTGDIAAEMSVGSVIDQVLYQLITAFLGSSMQGGNAHRIGPVQVGPTFNQQLYCRQLIVLSRAIEGLRRQARASETAGLTSAPPAAAGEIRSVADELERKLEKLK